MEIGRGTLRGLAGAWCVHCPRRALGANPPMLVGRSPSSLLEGAPRLVRGLDDLDDRGVPAGVGEVAGAPAHARAIELRTVRVHGGERPAHEQRPGGALVTSTLALYVEGFTWPARD